MFTTILNIALYLTGKFTAAHIKKSMNATVSSMLSAVLADPKLFALFKDVLAPIWSKPLDREPPKNLDPMIFSFLYAYQSACGYEVLHNVQHLYLIVY